MLTLSLVLELVTFLLVFTYMYAVLASFLFNSDLQSVSSSKYFNPQYTNFDTTELSMLTLFQILAQQRYWFGFPV